MSDATLYIPEPRSDPLGRAVTLPRKEGHHARALRLRPGDEVRVTDGDGQVWRARLEGDDGRPACTFAVSALKQCGGARLPEIGPVRDLHAYLSQERRPAPSGAPVEGGPDILLDRRAGPPLERVLEGWDGDPPLRLLLGPEGGLEPEERDACRRAGFVPASLGPRVLRFETAAVAGLAVAGQRLQAPSARAGEAGDPGIAADGRAPSAGGRA